MKEAVYQKLAQHLDRLPGGFPPTDGGVELRILRRLFTPEEAELALHLSLIPEEARVIARRAKISVDEASERLERMALKGLIFRIQPHDGAALYQALQFIIGIWEFHVNDLDAELVRDMDEYLPTLSKEAWKVPQLRTIPVGRSITAQMEALSLVDEKAVLNADRCIGCGLCVSTCPTQSLTLVRKPDSDQPRVPNDLIKLSIRLGQERGKLNTMNLVKMQVKSKIDRLLAAR